MSSFSANICNEVNGQTFQTPNCNHFDNARSSIEQQQSSNFCQAPKYSINNQDVTLKDHKQIL